MHISDEQDITASTTSQPFTLFDDSLTSAMEISWRILDPSVAEIMPGTGDTTTTSGGITSNTARLKGLKEGRTVLIATDSLTGKTVAAQITVSTGFTNPKLEIGNNFTIALREDGTIWGWGTNTSGQTGIGSGTSLVATPTLINKYYNPVSRTVFDLDPETIVDIPAPERQAQITLSLSQLTVKSMRGARTVTASLVTMRRIRRICRCSLSLLKVSI